MAKRIDNDPLLATEELAFTVNTILVEYLNKLVKTGCYGTKPSDVARILLSEAVCQLLQTEKVKEIEYDERHRPEKVPKED